MLSKLIIRSLFRFALTKFPKEVAETVLPTAPQLTRPQVVDTQTREQYREHNRIKFKRTPAADLTDNWTRDSHNRIFTEKEAVAEASRCMKCADSPCQKACSVGIDIRSFIYQIQNQNFYGAAKTILSDNPLGLSCGGLCPVSELCASTCNAHWLEGGSIEIGKLQEFACKVFKEMKVKQIRDPHLKPLDHRVVDTKIALIGAGSASLSCAAFLGRLGYSNVHIYEKEDYSGGLVTREIPANRSNYEDVLWEIQMVEELGVKLHYNKQYGKDITEDSLKA
jgi:dihydropyrimidine dehydrogenase (NADP+)